ncbi:6,7-dimethyl-8-ribityllumazine synthase [Algicella marina]|uniref:6,7-dimethyl-8-ribityllumazine synthase n=1 Tax=Algicella marina TaxID=2683284 RepID=A0A6P1SW59_9RHOB|nr:6,7-dimethyl-8-ribityllumazine synthase [Algicella marina]QHQ33890.1 6,7-dimethyl-8-ribityllumazine synthase [Algicella marina]
MATSITHYSLPAPVFDRPTRIAIVVSPYYREIADQLLAGAKAACEAAKAMYDVIEVPGALEIPPAIGLAARSGEFDGYVALGCVIRGETTHYETVCNDSSRGLMHLGLEGHAIGNGILTVDNVDQAVVRAEAAGQNKGGGAADAALHLVALARRFQASRPVPPADTGEFRVAGSDQTPTIG